MYMISSSVEVILRYQKEQLFHPAPFTVSMQYSIRFPHLSKSRSKFRSKFIAEISPSSTSPVLTQIRINRLNMAGSIGCHNR